VRPISPISQAEAESLVRSGYVITQLPAENGEHVYQVLMPGAVSFEDLLLRALAACEQKESVGAGSTGGCRQRPGISPRATI
jgi:hypothetical protein